jgi:hypothetical protein
MRIAVYAPLVFSLLLALPPLTAGLRALPDRVSPRAVLVLLTSMLAVTAAATTVSLSLIVAGGVAHLGAAQPLVAPDGHDDPAAVPAGVVGALVLGVVLIRAGSATTRRVHRRRRVRAELADDDRRVIVVEDDGVFAAATPPSRGRPGRVIVSRGLLTKLDARERAAVLAHEQAHLDLGHHRHLTVGALAVALNPLLAAWWPHLAYSAERCADEGAARLLEDRRVVGHAVGHAALAAHTAAPRSARHQALADPVLSPSVTGGAVPRRVAALLASDLRHECGGRMLSVDGFAVPLLAAATLLTLASLAGAGAAHAAWDLKEILAPLIVG